MAMETQDIIKRSATNPITPAPRARDYKAEVAAYRCLFLRGLQSLRWLVQSGTISAMR